MPEEKKGGTPATRKETPVAKITPVKKPVPTTASLPQRSNTVTVGGVQVKSSDVEDPSSIIRQGMLVVLLFFGVLGAGAYFGHIQGAIVAQGTIKIETERKTVQHLEGGIVDSILVNEGDQVKEGQPLLVLESVRVDADKASLEKQLVALEAVLLRAQAEKNQKKTLEWPEELKQRAKQQNCEDVLINEMRNFQAKRDSLHSQISLLESQMAQTQIQVSGLEDQLQAEGRIIAALREELQAKRELLRGRYIDKSQVLGLERELAGHDGRRGSLRQSIAEAKQHNAELRLRITDTQTHAVEQASGEVSRTQNDILQTTERLRPLTDTKERLQVTAPVTGKIVGLKVHSRGGVIHSGEPLMDIVPDDNPLIVETQIPVNKITEVYAGQDAFVQLDAFDIRTTPNVPGKVTYVAADRMEAQGIGPYYLCHVEIDPSGLEKENIYMSPGMPATVFITTKRRTVLNYLLEPLMKSWDRALRD